MLDDLTRHLLLLRWVYATATLRLIRHDISGKNALLRLLPLDLERRQRVQQFVYAPRRLVLALI